MRTRTQPAVSRERAASRTRGRPATNRYDLLDFMLNQFDRDYLEFNANIHELESSLQGFINSSFENISSTQSALELLKQLQSFLQARAQRRCLSRDRETHSFRSAPSQRDSLKDDLDAKSLVIFHNYALDLETVQRIYARRGLEPGFFPDCSS